MTVNWGDIVINDMANRDENRAREARFLAKAGHFPPAKPGRSLVDIARTIRRNLTSTHTADVVDSNLNTHQEPAV